jgi:hypothetical protein
MTDLDNLPEKRSLGLRVLSIVCAASVWLILLGFMAAICRLFYAMLKRLFL